MDSSTKRVDPTVETPASWYTLGFTPELALNSYIVRMLAGRRVLLVRDGEGCVQAYVIRCTDLADKLLPHGSIAKLECPRHAGLTERCAQPCHVRERNYQLMIWYPLEAEKVPWEVAPLPMEDYYDPLFSSYVLTSNPQQIQENSVDVGHFEATHQYHNARVLEPHVFDEYEMCCTYGVDSKWRIQRPHYPPTKNEISIRLTGLGHSVASVRTFGGHMRFRVYVLPSPLEPGRSTYRMALQLHRLTQSSLLPIKMLHLRPLRDLVRFAMLHTYKVEVQADFAIWNHMRYVETPRLADGDGPIGKYRQWTKRFYEEARRSMPSDSSPAE